MTMNYFILNIGLALIWMLVTGRFTPANLLVGLGLSYATLFVAQRVIGPSAYFGKVRQALGFLVFFVRELIESNIRVAIDVLRPQYRMQPRVMTLALDGLSDAEITLLASLIALTPGTLPLDVSSDRRTLYIHAMDARDEEAVRRQITEGLQRRVLTLMHGHSDHPSLASSSPANPAEEESRHAA